MKSQCKWGLIGSLLLLSLLIQYPVDASEVKGQQSDSPFKIGIKKSPVVLQKISVPVFEAEAITGETLVIHPQEDFVMEVQDNRKVKEGSWDVTYELSAFNQSGEEVGIIMKLDKGKLRVDGKEMSTDLYEAKSVELKAEEPSSILKATSSSQGTTYGYTISKESISLHIDKSVSEGTYKALQTVSLLQVPTTD